MAGRKRKYFTLEEFKAAKNRAAEKSHIKSGYFQRDDVKKRMKLLQEKYSLIRIANRIVKKEGRFWSYEEGVLEMIKKRVYQINAILFLKKY